MIEVVGLTKRYGSTTAVNDLSFAVRPGIVTGFLGPNGAGKSTTMRMILGLETPTSGRALIDGKPYAELDQPLTKVGALLDANWIHPNRSAKAHLKFLAATNNLPTSRVDAALEMVGLTSVAGKAAGKFSLGMKQRLGLASALLGDPQILLFDEPVNGLDPEGIFWIRTFMRQLAGEGRTVLVSSHLLSEMAQTADHLVVIGQGRLIADCSTTDFTERSSRSFVRVRSPRLTDLAGALQAAGIAAESTGNGADAALQITDTPTERIGDIAGQAGIVLHELSVQGGSLEQAFIELTASSVQYGDAAKAATTVPSSAGVHS